MGGTAKLISESILSHDMNCAFHVFDTFDGMPDAVGPGSRPAFSMYSQTIRSPTFNALLSNIHRSGVAVHHGHFS